MARLRALFLAVVVAGAVAGVCATRSHAATPPPPCFPDSAQQNATYPTAPPSTGPNEFSSAHFDIWYSSDPTSDNYLTEPQAGDLAALAERAYSAYAALGFPAPLVDGSTGKSEIYVINMKTLGLVSEVCVGSFYFDSNTIGTSSEQISVGWDIFALVEEVTGFGDFWFSQSTAQWAAAKIWGYPSDAVSDVGPFEVSIDCWDPNYNVGMSRCSKNGYENLAQSRWPFEEYLDEKFGTAFILEALQDAGAAGNALTGLQNALAAHGSNLTTEYNAYAGKLISSSWTAAPLNLATIPISGSAIQTGIATSDTPSQTFSVDHLATRFVEFDRGDGSGSHACYAATLKITVQLPAGVPSQPTFFWNAGGSPPVPLTVNGSTATATVPWDTCQWSSKGLLSLPNPTTNVDSANFTVSAHLTVDQNTPATAKPAPAQASTYGQVVSVGSQNVAPTVTVWGPQVISVAATDTKIKLIVQSSGDGTLKATLGSVNLGSSDLRAGQNAVSFSVPAGTLLSVRKSAADGSAVITLTPVSSDGKTSGSAVTRKVTVLGNTTAKHTAAKPAAKAKTKPATSKSKAKPKKSTK